MADRPSWLNETFISTLLNSPSNNDVTITSHEIEPAVPSGENYFSVISRVKVNYKVSSDRAEKPITFITKSMPDGVLSEFLNDINAMHKELCLYRLIAPQIERLTNVKFTPKSYCSDHADLIMEDLRVKGYKMADRVEQLDYEHCTAALEALARFQAASVVLHDEQPELFKVVGEETVYPMLEAQRSFTDNAFNLLVDEVKSWPGAEHYVPRLRKASVEIFDKVGEAIEPSRSAINVLNHGDFWCNNLLYSYDGEGKVADVRLIDWQLCRWTTPAMDLQMFFNTSVKDLQSVGELTRVYLTAFNQTLQRLGHKTLLTQEQLEADLRRTDCFGLFVSVSLLPICIGTRGQQMDFGGTTMDDFTSGFVNSNPYAIIYKGLKYKNIMPTFLQLFSDKGVL